MSWWFRAGAAVLWRAWREGVYDVGGAVGLMTLVFSLVYVVGSGGGEGVGWALVSVAIPADKGLGRLCCGWGR